jgi:trimeric autotransporter adhesin
MAIARYPFRTIALAPFLLIAGLTGPAIAQQRVGVDSAVNPAATGITPGAVPRRLVLGQEVVFNERITTGVTGQTQILFVDETSMTLGPNGDMVIDEFVYDPNAGTGKLAASLSRGVFRFVGGKLSKLDNAVTMRTPSAIIGVRGGVMLVNLLPSGRLEVIFGYGKGLTVTGLNGASETITRPGFEVTVAGPGASPSAPVPAPPDAAEALLAQLDGRSDGNGGARTIPTETMVANSGIANIISSNIAASRGAAAQTRPPPAQPPNASTAVQQSEWNVQNVAYQGATVTPVSGGSPVPLINFYKNQTLSGTPVSATGVGAARVVATYAGLVKTTSDPTVGFTDQTGSSRIPYTNGILTFPLGSPQNGIFSASLGSLGNVSFPLVPGAASLGPANTSSPVGPLTGTTFLSPDNTFFYANLQAPAFPSGRGFIFGGQALPTDPSSTLLTTAPGSAQLYTFALQPDAALQSPVPFTTQSTGGNIPNPSVSPYYVVAPGQSPFGAFNPNTNPNATGTRSLQASLAINGPPGTSQTSALVVQTGSFFTASNTNRVAGDGVVRGSFLANGTSPPVRIGSGAATVPDSNGNNIFGTGTGSLPISGFVLDQNQYNTSLNFVPNQVAVQVPLGGSSSTYAFNQPATATSLNQNTAFGTRTTQTLSGDFGGIMYQTASGTTSPYAATGSTSIQTNATNNRVAATFSGGDRFGNTTLSVQFGGFTGISRSRSAFVDDTRYAALENPDTPSQVNGINIQLNGDPTQASHIAMVTSGTVPSNSLLPNGLCSACQFLQWGYWTGELNSPNAAGTAVVRQDTAHINTWVAGIPTVTLPTSGTGTFTGNALGSVSNNGANYLAAGGFTNTYNFGTQTGTVAISNFDGRSFSGPVTAAAFAGRTSSYAGNLSGSGVTGAVQGTFFGPGAPETGGNFAVQSLPGVPTYLASGIFAGRR